ncbi:MAG: hypothetical protein O8C66_09400 [Candidatus Methanoperedens sp.]|nr:hypothetical protein [Candidatus Methanoperedens sp.]MCZ7370710.1 hypothetical protein [Candidatus Methanoperedens sp.]
MDDLDYFKELAADIQHSEINIPIMDIELTLSVKYFLNDSGVGYCSLLINKIHASGLKGNIEAAAAEAYVGRSIFIFLSELDDGLKLITVPALFEKQSCLDEKIYLANFIVNAYYPADFKKTAHEVYEEHMNALIGKKIRKDVAYLSRSILNLPTIALEILRCYR